MVNNLEGKSWVTGFWLSFCVCVCAFILISNCHSFSSALYGQGWTGWWLWWVEARGTMLASLVESIETRCQVNQGTPLQELEWGPKFPQNYRFTKSRSFPLDSYFNITSCQIKWFFPLNYEPLFNIMFIFHTFVSISISMYKCR